MKMCKMNMEVLNVRKSLSFDGQIPQRMSWEPICADVIGNYLVGKTIGVGAFGVIREGHHKLTKKQVAIKFIQNEPQVLSMLTAEVNITGKLNHPNIVKLYEVLQWKETNETCLIMEYVGRDLLDYISMKGHLSEVESRHFIKQIINGVKYCHSNSIVHRDLKLENILIDSRKTVKIIDFGLAAFIFPDKKLNLFCGSPQYAAPEMLTKKEYFGPEIDIWSIGVILYCMLTGQFPWEGTSIFDQVENIVQGKWIVPHQIAPSCIHLLNWIFQVDPQKRATMEDILSHPWLQK